MSGVSLVVGVSLVLETLCTQAYGAGNCGYAMGLGAASMLMHCVGTRCPGTALRHVTHAPVHVLPVRLCMQCKCVLCLVAVSFILLNVLKYVISNLSRCCFRL